MVVRDLNDAEACEVESSRSLRVVPVVLHRSVQVWPEAGDVIARWIAQPHFSAWLFPAPSCGLSGSFHHRAIALCEADSGSLSHDGESVTNKSIA